MELMPLFFMVNSVVNISVPLFCRLWPLLNVASGWMVNS